MKLNAFKKLGIAVVLVAVLGSSEDVKYEINNLGYSSFNSSIIGSTVDFRVQSINKDFENILKDKTLDEESKREVAEIKFFINSHQYKQNLVDKSFFDDEKLYGVPNFVKTLGTTKAKFSNFRELLAEEGWDLSFTNSKEYNIAHIDTIEFHLLANVRDNDTGTFGFFNQKKGLKFYSEARTFFDDHYFTTDKEPVVLSISNQATETDNNDKVMVNINKIRENSLNKNNNNNNDLVKLSKI